MCHKHPNNLLIFSLWCEKRCLTPTCLDTHTARTFTPTIATAKIFFYLFGCWKCQILCLLIALFDIFRSLYVSPSHFHSSSFSIFEQEFKIKCDKCVYPKMKMNGIFSFSLIFYFTHTMEKVRRLDKQNAYVLK